MIIKASDLEIRRGAFTVTAGSLSLQPGPIHLLTGSNGTGKTTLLDALSGRRGISGGSLTVNDRIACRLELRTSIACVAQERPWLDEFSLAQVRRMAPLFYDRFDSGVFDGMIRDAGLKLSSKLGTFSSGEQRFVDISVALASGSGGVFIDEAVAHLDPSRLAIWLDCARAVALKATVVAAVQDLSQIRISDAVIRTLVRVSPERSELRNA